MTIFTTFANIVFMVFHAFGININTVNGADTMIVLIIVVIGAIVMRGVLRDIGIISRNR